MFLDPRRASHAAGGRKVIAIHGLRSSVPGIPAKHARRVFIASLVKSGAFAFADAARRSPGSPSYIFDATVRCWNQDQRPAADAINIDRIAADGKGSHDTIGIEVRVVDASSGLVLDSISAQEHDLRPIDRALCTCVDLAVFELIKRYAGK
jgi:hypothetical protein